VSRLPLCLISCLALGVSGSACEDLRDWKTGPNEVFRGEVIGSDSNSGGDSFIRKGFVSHTWLELSFDPGSTDLTDQGEPDAGIKPAAGTVNTFACPDGSATCDAAERTPGPFVDAPLVPIDGLTHDPLSQLTFPGGRLQNYIFGARFRAQRGERSYGRDATLIVSLMQNHRVEVRAMAPSVNGADGEADFLPAMFGVFSLTRIER
jgi:hypothetical protein